MMPAMRTVGIFLFALATGCVGGKEVPPSVMAQSAPLIVDPSLLGRNQDGAVAAGPQQSESIREADSVTSPPAALRRPVVIGIDSAGIAPPPGVPVSPSGSQGAANQPQKDEGPPPVAKKPEPPLDVAALKARLRDTNAIGLFTKLALKNQVDDLLEQFRAHYLSRQNANVAALRQSYDMLVLKVLALIQDSDPSLARTISGSREAIWSILADPEKFRLAS